MKTQSPKRPARRSRLDMVRVRFAAAAEYDVPVAAWRRCRALSRAAAGGCLPADEIRRLARAGTPVRTQVLPREIAVWAKRGSRVVLEATGTQPM